MFDTIRIPEREIIKWRRHIHEYPEMSFNEINTAVYVEELLKSFGNIVVSRPTKTSVMGILKGVGDGKTIMLRADMDALSVDEETNLPFASKNNGVMHACGHDAHTAILLGAAKVLSSMTDNINGTIKFVFQHAEEQKTGGARELVDAGILNDVDAVFGLHIFPKIKTGAIGIVNGAVTSISDNFFLKIQGRGSHGSMPENSIDPILVGSEIVMALNTIISRNISPKETAVLSVGEFNSGTAPNIIPDTASLSGTIRTKNIETREVLEKHLRDVVEHITKLNGATYEFDYVKGYSSVVNDADLAELAFSSITKVNGEDMVFEGESLSIGEDFSAYTAVKPGCFLFLGGGLAEDGYEYMNHHPKFIIDEDALSYGVKAEVQITLDYLNG